jgi:hypothetical protein
VITRTAIFEGRVTPGQEARFYAEVAARLMPLWLRFPHAQNVRWLRCLHADQGAPQIAMIQQIDYASEAAMNEALNSAGRIEARGITRELLQSFDGRLYHIVSECHPTTSPADG